MELVILHDVALAQILRGRLQSEGIEVHLFDSGFSGLLGGGFPGIRLMVAEERESEARDILDMPENRA